MKPLVGHDRGPGIAAGVVLFHLMQMLVERGVISADDVTSILNKSDAEISAWGESNIAVKDARTILGKLRA